MARVLLTVLLAALVTACASQSTRATSAAYHPTPPGDMLGGWYDSTGPRGRSGGGP
ncbi:MAG TPA: hypothetical protein VFB71_08970 [Ramlibacter sp.]|nr:hypothetical protein [Ramlibacter sp.]